MSEKKENLVLFPPLPLWGNGIAAAPAPGPIVTDPNGSYTGRAQDQEKPVQDADDL